ncbi:MAG: signal transduction histidine kinase, nitrogen specific, NtrB [Anaerosporomusa subterranea]|nr:signal transduction histidine kinase, nitrogen specific, NtrB [Anaerosporomusa subterranea]
MINQPLLRQFRLWTVLIVVVPGLLIMAIYTFGQFTAAKKEKLELISQRVEFQQKIIEAWIKERSNELRGMSRMEVFRTLNLQQMETMLYLMQEEKEHFNSLSYIDKQGVFRISTLKSGIRFPTAIGQPYFDAAIAGKEFISDIVVGRNSGLSLINFSAPIYDQAGVFQGLILGSVRTTTLETMLRDNWIGQAGEIVLVNRDGMLIAQPRDAYALIDKGLAKGTLRMKLNRSADIFTVAHLGENGSGNGLNYMGDKVLGAYRHLPERDWTLVGSIDENEILFPIYQQLLLMAGATLLLVLAILPLLALLVDRITLPIEWLIKQSELVAEENYGLVGGSRYLKDAPRELANLCSAFVTMSKKIQSSVSLIKDREAQLEDKVREIETVNSALKTEIVDRQKAQSELEEVNAVLELTVGRRTSQLLQREQHYRKLIENIPDCIGRYDREYDRIYANQAALLDAAMPETLAVDDAWGERDLPSQSYLPWMHKLAAVFETGQLEQFEAWGGPRDRQRFYTVRFIPEYNLQREIATVLCVATDITDKRRVEADMARLGLLDIVGEMAVGIGHEVRNPMTTVRGYLQLFQQKEVFANYHSQIQDMIEEVDKANGIISDFLSLAKDKAVKMKHGNLNQLLESLYPLLQADASHRGHEILLDLGEIPESDFDEKEIRQMTLNLVHNGLEAMSRGGVITIKTGLEQGNIFLSVSDTGGGIPPEVLEKLGTPFVTSKDMKTGLGLPICFRIAQRHNAKIDVVTGPQGTTFTVDFPILD